MLGDIFFFKKLLRLLFIGSIVVGCSRSVEGPGKRAVSIQKTAKGYRLIRNGVPFLIKGAGGDIRYLKELQQAGANTIRIYDTLHLQSKLDKVQKVGMVAVVDIPIPRYDSQNDHFYTNKDKVTDHANIIKAFIEKYKDHPAVLYWILGNEIQYPELKGNKNFVSAFNQFVQCIHDTDQNHPVSTAVAGLSRKRIISISQRSKKLDFISINLFGQLSSLKKRINSIRLFWNGPYVISEWGVNGPWEAEKTKWNSPIEQTSTKKAELYGARYQEFIAPLTTGKCMGDLAFYWGQKQETTQTWFSVFTENGNKTELVSTLESIWTNTPNKPWGPKINYLLVNDKGSNESLVVEAKQNMKAKLISNHLSTSQNRITWDVKPEGWFYYKWKNQQKLPSQFAMEHTNSSILTFSAPEEPGPYRLFVSLQNQKGEAATTNFPFYVLKPEANNE